MNYYSSFCTDIVSAQRLHNLEICPITTATESTGHLTKFQKFYPIPSYFTWLQTVHGCVTLLMVSFDSPSVVNKYQVQTYGSVKYNSHCTKERSLTVKSSCTDPVRGRAKSWEVYIILSGDSKAIGSSMHTDASCWLNKPIINQSLHTCTQLCTMHTIQSYISVTIVGVHQERWWLQYPSVSDRMFMTCGGSKPTNNNYCVASKVCG